MVKRFVIHEHHARNLHFDLRLEIDGVLKSWAVPKGPSFNPKDKRLAVAVPDHSLIYAQFEGTIAEGNYGAGRVVIWDDGHYETTGNPLSEYNAGKLVVTFFGIKMRGEFALVKMKDRGNNWLLIKSNDHFADTRWQMEPVLAVAKKRGSKPD